MSAFSEGGCYCYIRAAYLFIWDPNKYIFIWDLFWSYVNDNFICRLKQSVGIRQWGRKVSAADNKSEIGRDLPVNGTIKSNPFKAPGLCSLEAWVITSTIPEC